MIDILCGDLDQDDYGETYAVVWGLLERARLVEKVLFLLLVCVVCSPSRACWCISFLARFLARLHVSISYEMRRNEPAARRPCLRRLPHLVGTCRHVSRLLLALNETKWKSRSLVVVHLVVGYVTLLRKCTEADVLVH